LVTHSSPEIFNKRGDTVALNINTVYLIGHVRTTKTFAIMDSIAGKGQVNVDTFIDQLHEQWMNRK